MFLGSWACFCLCCKTFLSVGGDKDKGRPSQDQDSSRPRHQGTRQTQAQFSTSVYLHVLICNWEGWHQVTHNLLKKRIGLMGACLICTFHLAVARVTSGYDVSDPCLSHRITEHALRIPKALYQLRGLLGLPVSHLPLWPHRQQCMLQGNGKKARLLAQVVHGVVWLGGCTLGMMHGSWRD